jgi:hypothetical protein
MRRDFLATLHCPYSGLPFSISMELIADAEKIDYGIVSSEGTDFPIVEGILRLHVDEYREPIVEHLRRGGRSQALVAALDRGSFGGRVSAAIHLLSSIAFRTGFRSIGEPLNRLKRSSVGVLRDNRKAYAEIVEELSDDSSHDHQIYRFTMPGFLSTLALAHLVKCDGWVLCFACGTGHEPFLISRMWPNTNIACADYSFTALFMAKRYFAPEASYVCLDGDYLLPFESGQFSTIFSSDTLPVLDSKLNLAQEFRRVGDERAVTLLPHMTNRLVGPFAKALTPHGYRHLFRDMEIRMLPDDKVVRDYFFEDSLDLTKDWSNEELIAAKQHLSIIACRDSSLFVRHENLWNQRIRSFRHPRINPAYRITGPPGNWELTREVQDRYAKPISQLDQVCLPDTCRVIAPSVDSAGLHELRRSDPAQFAQLAKSLVVLDLPEHFFAQGARSRTRTNTPAGSQYRHGPAIAG